MRAMTNDDDLSPLPTIRTGRYRHYKGKEYRVQEGDVLHFRFNV